MDKKNLMSMLEPDEDVTSHEILMNLLKGDEDLDLKTQIDNPRGISTLFLLADYIESYKLRESAELLRGWTNDFLRKMVSYKRLSRKEVVKALTPLIEEEREKRANEDLK